MEFTSHANSIFSIRQRRLPNCQLLVINTPLATNVLGLLWYLLTSSSCVSTAPNLHLNASEMNGIVLKRCHWSHELCTFCMHLLAANAILATDTPLAVWAVHARQSCYSPVESVLGWSFTRFVHWANLDAVWKESRWVNTRVWQAVAWRRMSVLCGSALWHIATVHVATLKLTDIDRCSVEHVEVSSAKMRRDKQDFDKVSE